MDERTARGTKLLIAAWGVVMFVALPVYARSTGMWLFVLAGGLVLITIFTCIRVLIHGSGLARWAAGGIAAVLGSGVAYWFYNLALVQTSSN